AAPRRPGPLLGRRPTGAGRLGQAAARRARRAHGGLADAGGARGRSRRAGRPQGGPGDGAGPRVPPGRAEPQRAVPPRSDGEGGRVNADTAARSLHLVYLIARREFLTRVRTRFFILGTALMVVVLAAYILVQVLVIDKSTGTPLKVGLAGSAQVLAPAFKAQAALAGTGVQ